MAEPENADVVEYPVRIIEVRYGIDEDGGGLAIHVRMDGVDPEKLLDVVLTLFEKVNGKDGGKIHEPHGKGYC